MQSARAFRNLAVSLALMASGAGRGDGSDRPAWRVLVYACADYREGDNGIVESVMKQLVAHDDNSIVDVLGYVDVHNGMSMELCSNGALRAGCLVTACPGEADCDSFDPEMAYAGSAADTEVSTLRSRLIDRAVARPVPTKGTVLIVVGHADGWLGCQFDTDGAALLASTVASALKGGQMADGATHDPLPASVLMFFGCHMGQVEALVPVADVAEQIVAGELEIEADSINFARWISWLRADPERTPSEVATRLAALYHCALLENCDTCGKRDEKGAHVMTTVSGSGVTKISEMLDEFAKAAQLLPDNARESLYEHLARRRRAVNPWFSGAAGYSVDLAALFSEPSDAAPLASLVGPSSAVLEALHDAVTCMSAHPTLESFGGLSVLLTCRSGVLKEYEALCPATMRTWLSFERDYAAAERCGSDPNSKVEPVVTPPLAGGAEVVPIGVHRSFRYALVGVTANSIVDVSWTVVGPDGAIVGDGVPVTRERWGFDLERGFHVAWDGSVRRVATGAAETPAPIESERVVGLDGRRLRYSTIVGRWMPRCRDRWATVRMVFARAEASGSGSDSLLVDAQEIPDDCSTTGWGAHVDLSDGALSFAPSAGAALGAASLCSVGVGSSGEIRLTRALAEPATYQLVLSVRLGSGATIVSSRRAVRVVGP